MNQKINAACRKMPGLVFAGLLFLCGCQDKNAEVLLFGDSVPAQLTEEEPGKSGEPADAALGESDGIAGNGVQDGAAGFPDMEEAGAEAGNAGQNSDVAQDTSQGASETVCIVHICGAVENPGVYRLPEGSRVMDAVEAGGGFLEEADQAACNLAQPVADGCQIYIATKEERSRMEEMPYSAGIRQAKNLPDAYRSGQDSDRKTAGSGQEDSVGKVNLNTADASALKTLPGIGDSRAAAIIAFRQENGQFTCIEDIMKVSGIKQAAFDKIKDRITV